MSKDRKTNGSIPSIKPKAPPLVAFHVKDAIPPAALKLHREGPVGAIQASLDIIKQGVAQLATHPNYDKLCTEGGRYGVRTILIICVEKE